MRDVPMSGNLEELGKDHQEERIPLVRLGPHICNPFFPSLTLDGRFLAEPPGRSRRVFATATSDAPQSRLLQQNARRVPLGNRPYVIEKPRRSTVGVNRLSINPYWLPASATSSWR